MNPNDTKLDRELREQERKKALAVPALKSRLQNPVNLEFRDAPLKLLDLGTGSGCILVTLLAELPRAGGVGIDGMIDQALDHGRRGEHRHAAMCLQQRIDLGRVEAA